jgi:hypothetical protein
MGLVGNADFSNMNYLATGTGAYARGALAKLNDTVNVLDFYNGTYSAGMNITTALTNACASLTYGGVVYIPPGYFTLTPPFVTPPFVRVVGALASPGENDFDLNYKAHGTSIGISGTAIGNGGCGINIGMGAKWEGVTVLNSDITYPVAQTCSYTSGQTQQLSMTIANILAQIRAFNTYSCSAFFLTDNEARLKDCLIIGFAYAYQVAPTYRFGTGQLLACVKVDGILYDCTNGPVITGVDDTSEFNFHHGWQYITGHIGANPSDPDARINSSGTALPLTANARDVTYRSGIGILIEGHVDGALLSDCFTYNWQTSVELYASGPQTSARLKNCGADCSWGAAGSGSVADVANNYSTYGLFSNNSSAMSLTGEFYTGAVGLAIVAEHTATNALFDIDLVAGICTNYVAYFGPSSKGAIGIFISGGTNYSLDFGSGIGKWKIKKLVCMDTSFPGSSGALAIIAAGDLPNVDADGATIDAASVANGVYDNLGIRRFGLRLDQIEGGNSVTGQTISANGALSFAVGCPGAVAGVDAFAGYTTAAPAGGAVGMPGVTVQGFINTNGYVEVTYGNYTTSGVTIPAHTIIVRVLKR